MADEYEQMDSWTAEDVALFKEAALDEVVDARPIAYEAPAAAPGPVTLVAEGDSWFDYPPGTDVIDCLRYYHRYRIVNEARAGDTLENMIYGTGITRGFGAVSPTIAVVLKRLERLTPKVFLFSGGGNDIAGDEFASYLNHAGSRLPAVRKDYVEAMIHVVFRRYFEDLIAKVAEASPQTTILAHGYAHTMPTGKGVNLWAFRFAGPWLLPALARKRILNRAEQERAVTTIVDTYNEMLASLAQAHERFLYVDLRDLIDAKKDWANELHLNNSAYRRVADRIHESIRTL